MERQYKDIIFSKAVQDKKISKRRTGAVIYYLMTEVSSMNRSLPSCLGMTYNATNHKAQILSLKVEQDEILEN